MRATATLLTVFLAWEATAPASSALAGSANVAGSAAIAGWTFGQSATGGSSDSRRESDQLLGQARKAMADGNLALAERYIERAEKLNVKYDAMFARFQDTPEQVRRDLAKLRAAGTDSSRTPPSSPLSGASAGLPEPRWSQFPQSLSEGAVPNASQPSRIPQPPDATPQTSSGSAASADADERGQAKVESLALLLNARQALAARNLRQAADLVAQAKKLNVAYQLHEDSPAKVESLMRKASGFLQPTGPAADPAEHQREQARFLMEQADGLLQYKDIEHAYRLAIEAENVGADFRGFERNPGQLLRQIAAQQAPSTAGGSPLEPASFQLQDGRGPRPALSAAAAGADAAAADGAKREALRLVALARMALDRGNIAEAQRLAQEAQQLKVPDAAFTTDETRPWQVLLEINRALNRRPSAVVSAGGSGNVGGAAEQAAGLGGGYPVVQSLYTANRDATRNVLAGAQSDAPAETPPAAAPAASEAMRHLQDGMRALEQRDRETAMRHFQEAWRGQEQLDPTSRQALQDKLTLLNARGAEPAPINHGPSPVEEVDAKQQLLYQKLQREITSEQAEARKASAKDPFGALERLQTLRDRVRESELDPAARKQLLTMVDRSVTELQQYIDANRSQIELEQRNQSIRDGIVLDQKKTIEVQTKIAQLVEEFNTLLDEQRYAEAEVLAKQARELDPTSPVVQNLIWKSRTVRRVMEQVAIDEAKEKGFYDAMTSVHEASTPADDRRPFVLPDAKDWNSMSDRRRKMLEQQRSRLTPAEMEIQKSMKTPVEVRFSDRPLAEVMESLGAMAGVNIFLDPQGLAAEGVMTDSPVTINLTQPISLQSALNLILEPLRLSYVLQNEVLRVTSEQTRDSDVYPRVYNVADLVIPIPNFVPGYNVGLPAAIREAHNAVGYGGVARPMGMGPLTIAADEGAGQDLDNRSVLAQMSTSSLLPNSAGGRVPRQLGNGPGGLGGAALADFDTLINLLVSTVSPESWDEVGGPGAIEPFPTNLSLVVSQTQEVHDQIVELLDQLRRLQDLQVTIEVRFITLNDRFFERIGIDFDFDIVSEMDPNRVQDQIDNDSGPSATIGLGPDGLPTANMNLSFSQGGFGSTVPQFGPFDAGSAANFGFAILSDIEVFFLLQAAQGDTRSNVLQAPKVTLFNGQLASVSDVSQTPFVTSIIPVVGDFAAAHQPVIVVLSEGTSLSVQAVVSSDRRFVRFTLVPFFSQIGDVETFTFNGTTTTNSGSNVIDPDGNPTGDVNNAQTTRTGTTVQLPTFVYTTVNTTVSVPDGGTVLLGGIKRLSEGRNERGVPMLNKLPYISRLFKNVGIGRQTESLMMMVTPRIIIQEEEELMQTGFDASAQ